MKTPNFTNIGYRTLQVGNDAFLPSYVPVRMFECSLKLLAKKLKMSCKDLKIAKNNERNCPHHENVNIIFCQPNQTKPTTRTINNHGMGSRYIQIMF